MKRSVLKFSLAILSLTIFGCNEATTFQSLDINDSYNSYAKSSKKRDDWFDKLSPELQAYYADAKGKTGMELFDALHEIISRNNNIISYTDSRQFLFSVIDNISTPEKSGVVGAYSQVFIQGSGPFSEGYKEDGDANKDGVSGDNINAEHSWPQSFYGKSLPMVGDLHSLRVTLSTPNVMRRDFPFGEVSQNIVYTTSCGSKLSVIDTNGRKVPYKTVKQKFLALGDNAQSEYRGIFEPCDPEKGNTARGLMYFYLRYYDMYIRQGSYDSNGFWLDNVPMFIRWSEKVDPVNSTDRKRNDDVYRKQGNRNPFIDIPNLGSILGEDVLRAKEANASRKRS